VKKNQNRHLHSGCGESLQSNILDEIMEREKEINSKGVSKAPKRGAGQEHMVGIKISSNE